MQLVISMGDPWLDMLMRLTLIGLFFLVWYYVVVILFKEAEATYRATVEWIKRRKNRNEDPPAPLINPMFLVEWSEHENFHLVERRYCHDYEHATRATNSLLDEFGPGYVRIFTQDGDEWIPYSESHGRSDETVEIQSFHPELTEVEVPAGSLATLPENTSSKYVLYWAPDPSFNDGEVKSLATDELEISASVLFVMEGAGFFKYRMRVEEDEENTYSWGPARDYSYTH